MAGVVDQHRLMRKIVLGHNFTITKPYNIWVAPNAAIMNATLACVPNIRFREVESGMVLEIDGRPYHTFKQADKLNMFLESFTD